MAAAPEIRRVDRSFQTVARAKPVRPDVDIASDVSPQPAQERLVVHSLAAVRLHLDGHELAVLDPRTPDRHGPPMQLAARADVRRERADPVQQLLRRGGPRALPGPRAGLF